ncbi:MAG: glycosyltransferase 87 family protein [Vicinamibacterales bacterium]
MKRTLIVWGLLAIAVVRFGSVAYRGLTYSIGDFYSTLPGAYVERFNPTLWASPDLTDLVGKSSSYHRGPTQYLTALPLALLDSYHEIALVLLVVFAILIAGAAFVMWRTFGGPSRDPILLGLILTTSLLFYPTLLAYVAREFELVMMAATTMLFAAALSRRETSIGAWTAYLSLYKFLPLALLPLLVTQRWWRALAGFAATAAIVLAAAHALFGLQNFSSDGFVQRFASHILTTLGSTQQFCHGPFDQLRYAAQSHDVSVRFALCGINERVPFPAATTYIALILAALVVLGYGFFRAERCAPLAAEAERWRRTWELSAVVIVYVTFFFAHYYYLTVLIVPLTALMVRAHQERSARLWAGWAASYLLLSAFLLPLSQITKWLQVDAFSLYLRTFAYLPGELLLLGMILYEYATLPLLTSADAA